MPEKRLVDLAAASKAVGVTPKTMRRWAADGRVTLYRIGPRFLRIDLNEIEGLIQTVPVVR